ncbi:MAG: DNA-directed RNA polymerase subunit beta', partial [Candidatus Thermochlorobacter sp.]
DKKVIITTVGRVLFNQIVPSEVGYINKVLDKKAVKDLIAQVINKAGNVKAVEFLDAIKEAGFTYAMKGGLSIALSDAIVPSKKEELIKGAQKDNLKVIKEYNAGTLTENEKYNKIVDVWQKVTNLVAEESYQTLRKDRDGFNPLFMMLDSGARGSREQVRQLTGMRGLIARPQKSMSGQPGEIIENPIISNLKEGLSVLEYFISTHGARKGLSDTSLKTADAGYLTRRLHDVAQDVIVTEEDC